METNQAPVFQSTFDPARLQTVVRKSIGSNTFQLQDWQASRLGGNAGNPVSAGLYRIEGTGSFGRAEQVQWSVILKIIQSPAFLGLEDMGEGDDPTHWNYWKREIHVYKSGLLKTLPEGMVAPLCFGIDRPGENVAWLWLEDIRDSLGGAWTLDRYALTARHLGRLNGRYAGQASIPTHPWLCSNLIGQWLARSRKGPISPDHPHLLALYPEGNPFRRMLLEGDRFVKALNQLPRTLCHGDTYPTNFMSRRLGVDGLESTVALDWALVNIGPLGDDLAQFIYGAQVNLKGIDRALITETLFEGYLAGLRDSGCRIDPVKVRFGFAATASLRVGLFQIFMLDEQLKQNLTPIIPPGEPSEGSDTFVAGMAQAAYDLIGKVA